VKVLSGVSDEHRRSIELWREARVQRLRSPDGWLTLVDRVLLEEGDNQLPIGIITLEGGKARLRARPEVTLNGAPAGERELRSDEGGPSDSLAFEGRVYELFRRGGAFAVRVKDPQAPALLQFSGLEYFPIDPTWRIVGRWERYQPPRQALHQYDLGAGLPRQVPGLARFEVAGRPCSLEPVLEEDGRRLFFVFSDQTNQSESYPAGRFLYATVPGGDEVVLDFNLAFNPPCAFTDFATCPITPQQNRLPIAVSAGEKRYRR
jgi:uncharacterized protein (DUF1684 family)